MAWARAARSSGSATRCGGPSGRSARRSRRSCATSSASGSTARRATSGSTTRVARCSRSSRATSGRRPTRRGSATRASCSASPGSSGRSTTPPRPSSPPPMPPGTARTSTTSGSDALVCHNDLCVENVVVRDGRVVAFIDFDFAAPSDPLLDIAIAARHWVPMRDPLDIDPELGRARPGRPVPRLRRRARAGAGPARGGDRAPRARSSTGRSWRCAVARSRASRRTSARGRAATRTRTAARGPGSTPTPPTSCADARLSSSAHPLRRLIGAAGALSHSGGGSSVRSRPRDATVQPPGASSRA